MSCFILDQAEDAGLHLMNQNFHFGAVTGLDVCVRKAIFATASADNSVRIWCVAQFDLSDRM